MLAWIVRLAIETGMRQSEILNLRVQDVDLGSRVARLADTKNNTARTVPLSTSATAALRSAISNPLRPKETNLVFFGEPGHDGKRRPYQFTKIWGDIKEAVGIDNLHFHDLRHEAVSRLVEGGLSDQEVITIASGEIDEKGKKQLAQLGIKLDGTLDITIPKNAEVLSHNATSTPSVFGLVGVYSWKIGSVEQRPIMKIRMKL